MHKSNARLGLIALALVVSVYGCGDEACEEKFQETSKATIRLVPTDDSKKENGACIVCGKPSHTRVLVAKSY